MGDEGDLRARISDPTRDDGPSGPLLRGRYEPLEVAGRGGQGQVLRAWDHHHHRAVALKVREIRPGEDRDAVLAEARMLVHLRPHPNIAIIRDDFFEGDRHYLVLDWIAGEDLRTRLRREGVPGLPFDLVAVAMADVASALDHLHSHEPPLVHGDVKPGNIVVLSGDEPHAVLVDFGLATVGEEEASGGTLAYAAPEVLTGSPPASAADVYSLAATAFELLTGRVPGPSATLDWSTVPAARVAAVREALVAGLALDPGVRPRSAGAFVDLLTGGARAPRRLLGRTRGSVRRSLLLAGAVTAAAIGGAALAVAVDDDPTAPAPPPADAAPATEENPFVPRPLPADEEEVGRVGIYTGQGFFATYLVGDAGSLASHQLQSGLTADWSQVVRLTEGVTVFYRSRDAYTVVVDWTADGAIVDLYSSTELVTGWTHLTRVGPQQLHLYDASSGNQALATFDDGAAIVAVTPLDATRAGWTHLVPLEDGRLLRYDAATGSASTLELDPTGAPSEAAVEGLPADLVALAGMADGRVVTGAGDSIRLLELGPSGPVVIDEYTADAPWSSIVAMPGGAVLVYDEVSGDAVVVAVSDRGFGEAERFETSPDGAILLGRV